MSGIVGVFAIGGAVVPCESQISAMADIIAHEDDWRVSITEHRLRVEVVMNPVLRQSCYQCDTTGAFVWLYGHFNNQYVLLNRIDSAGATPHNQAELVLRLYQSKGLMAFPMLKGAFAGIVWDPTTQRFLAFRDQIGVHHLYLRRDGDHLWFSTSDQALLHGESKCLDLEGLHQLILTGASVSVGLQHKLTALLPGSFAVVERGRLKSCQYWDWEPGQREALSSAQFQHQFGSSVDRILERAGQETLYSFSVESSNLVSAVCAHQTRLPLGQLPYSPLPDFADLCSFWGGVFGSFEALSQATSLMRAISCVEAGDQLVTNLGESMLFQPSVLPFRNRDTAFTLGLAEYRRTADYFDVDLQKRMAENAKTAEAAAFSMPLEWDQWQVIEQAQYFVLRTQIQESLTRLSDLALQAQVNVASPWLDFGFIEWLLNYNSAHYATPHFLGDTYENFMAEMQTPWRADTVDQHGIWSHYWPQCCILLQQQRSCTPLHWERVDTLIDMCRQQQGRLDAAARRSMILLASYHVLCSD